MKAPKAAKPRRARRPRRPLAPVYTLAIYRDLRAFAGHLAARGAPPVVPFSAPTLTVLLRQPLSAVAEVVAAAGKLGLRFESDPSFDPRSLFNSPPADVRPLAKVLPFRGRAG